MLLLYQSLLVAAEWPQAQFTVLRCGKCHILLFMAEPGYDWQETFDLGIVFRPELQHCIGKLFSNEGINAVANECHSGFSMRRLQATILKAIQKNNVGNLGVSSCKIMIRMHTKQAVHLCQIVYCIIGLF